MRMTKDEIRSLKNKHRIELVMQETSEAFDINSNHPNQWRSMTTPGLTVDTARQIFEIKLPGKNDESGDVFAWLMRRYNWTFAMAIKFLKKRIPDPKRESQSPSKATKKSQVIHDNENDSNPLDHWQEKALQIGGERIRKYFSWSYWSLVINSIHEDIRIDPVFAPQVTHCQRCEKRIDWLDGLEKDLMMVPVQHGYKLVHAGNIPIIAYSIKRPLKISDLGPIGRDEIANAINDLADAFGNVFVEEEDGLVCAACGIHEMEFQTALSLCKRSARNREQDEQRDARVIGGRGETHKNLL